MPQTGTGHPTVMIRNRLKDKLAFLSAPNCRTDWQGAMPESLLSCDRPNLQGWHSATFERGDKIMGNGAWSNDACRGYVILAMKNCGFSSDDIRGVVAQLREEFDFTAVEEAEQLYYKGDY